MILIISKFFFYDIFLNSGSHIFSLLFIFRYKGRGILDFERRGYINADIISSRKQNTFNVLVNYILLMSGLLMLVKIIFGGSGF